MCAVFEKCVYKLFVEFHHWFVVMREIWVKPLEQKKIHEPKKVL
jgi:hypothetical protein